jgi:hypothetical protein
MTRYYIQYPAILQQSLATLFPVLENLKDHLTRSDPSSPFSGAAKSLQRPATRNRQPRSHLNNNNNRTKQPANNRAGNHQKARWGPQGQMAMQASSSVPDRGRNCQATGSHSQYDG